MPPLCKSCNLTELTGKSSRCKQCTKDKKIAKGIIEEEEHSFFSLVGNTSFCQTCKRDKDKELDFYPQNLSTCKACLSSKNKTRCLESYEYQLWLGARHRAQTKGMDFTITLEDIEIPELCPVLGIPLVKRSSERFNSPSIDRIDNTKGYTPDNICVISYRANSLKNNASPEEMRRVLAYMEGRLLP